MRELKLTLSKEQMEKLPEGIREETKDSLGRRWIVFLKSVAEGLENISKGMEMVVSEITTWAIYIEGAFIGVATNEKPEEAVREAFQNAGLTSLPEAVEVKVVGPDGVFIVFTLSGEAYCTPLEQFMNEVAKSGQWITARQAKRTEIDALMEEIKKLPR